ncbi:DUF6011 domain-containing protein [Streptomyces sp. NBC_00963]|uniref:DUF6011 domain-containing protein n=1 Tax=unclassified Streptomyces TaxID=2593676 RepID=UPI00225C157D|nr:DUF6011 domain-containing protein [Streptomyces sp. NBC_01306]MCX4727307.1 DUF6011 domain-containing protein [Streptomyces sp. NBC_01306]WSX41484.1 DUF6011 domain-containing protein [Streptomyces sp. NBC_00963]
MSRAGPVDGVTGEPPALPGVTAGAGEGTGTADGAGPEDRSRTVLCRMCGRPLTGLASRRTGLGPACDAKLHPAGPDIRTRRHGVDQDPIPGLDGTSGGDARGDG